MANIPSASDLHDSDNSNTLYPGWIVVTAGFFITLILYGSYYSYGVFKTPIRDELGWSDSVYSGAHALYLIIHGVLAIILGRLCDKYGPQWVVAFGTLLIALGYGLTSQVDQPWQFYLCLSFLLGIGMGAAYVPPLVTVAKWFSNRRGLALGVVASGVGVGQITLPPFFEYLIGEFGWRDSFIVLAIMACMIGIPSAFFLRNPIVDVEKETETSAVEAMRTKSFWFLLWIFASLVFGTNIVMQHVVDHIKDNGIIGIPASLYITVIGASGIVGRIASGRIADNVRNKIVAAVCLTLQIVAFSWLFDADKLWEFYIIAALYGLGYGGTLPLIVKMSSEFFSTSSGGTIFGVLLAGASLGGASGVFFTGLIHDNTGEYTWAFFMAGIVIVIAAVVNLILNPPEEKNA